MCTSSTMAKITLACVLCWVEPQFKTRTGIFYLSIYLFFLPIANLFNKSFLRDVTKAARENAPR